MLLSDCSVSVTSLTYDVSETDNQSTNMAASVKMPDTILIKLTTRIGAIMFKFAETIDYISMPIAYL